MPKLSASSVRLAVGGGGRDAVDHAVGEGDVGRDPVGKRGIDQLGQADDGVLR